MSRETLEGYYRNNFLLLKTFGHTLNDLDNLIPWERTIYLHLVNKYYADLEKNRKK